MHATSRLCLLTLLAGCANYDFAKARLPDGGLDPNKLIADLEASGNESLSDGIWIPLIHLDITTFGRSEYDQPEGYELSQVTSFGPLFLAGSHDTSLYDPHGARIEQADKEWLGCGVLYYCHDTRVETVAGTRFDRNWRLLLALGSDDDAHYVRPQK